MDKPKVPEPSDEEIALSAYRLWLQEGCPHGRDREHWLRARKQLLAAKAEETAKQPGLAAAATTRKG
jgi:hypothetical protein